ncbi:hypothetical protein HDF26_001714 [Pedobacter cryoconitis]|uniref:putative glycolipid-binding domain-containing protein n=1 Tax=Pedobacter cryoconitis TaxID=188932 RepID=UPI00160981C9|nr:putative glycolipid-binding domain-containing protein [Pedobacter cryoconitis]MBB6271287.1 hypothetical protein [Pedobacter cryoconitis]
MAIPTDNYNQSIIWKGKDTLEVFTLEHNSYGIVAGGMVMCRAGNIRYKTILEQDWTITKLDIYLADYPHKHLQINYAGDGKWVNEYGIEMPELDGCEGVDLSITPFTKSLPLKTMVIGKDYKFKVVSIKFPELSFHAIEQVYQNLGSGIFSYKNSGNTNPTQLKVGKSGLIKDIDGHFQEIYQCHYT